MSLKMQVLLDDLDQDKPKAYTSGVVVLSRIVRK